MIEPAFFISLLGDYFLHGIFSSFQVLLKNVFFERALFFKKCATIFLTYL